MKPVVLLLTLTVASVSATYGNPQESGDRQTQEGARRQAVEPQDAERQAGSNDDALVPIELQIVIARFQGDKKVSSLPHALSLNAGKTRRPEFARLRMVGRVPLPGAS